MSKWKLQKKNQERKRRWSDTHADRRSTETEIISLGVVEAETPSSGSASTQHNESTTHAEPVASESSTPLPPEVQAELVACEATIASQRLQLSRMLPNLKSLNQQVGGALAAVDTILDQARHPNKHVATTIGEVIDEKMRLQHELQRSQRRLAESIALNDQRAQQLSAINQAHASYQNELVALRSQLDKSGVLVTEIERLQKSNAQLEQRLNGATELQELLRQQNLDNATKVEEADAKLAEASKKLQGAQVLSEQVDRNKHESERELRQRFSRLDERLNEQVDLNSQLSVSKLELERDKLELVRQIQAYADRLATLCTSEQELNQRLLETRGRLDVTTDELTRSRVRIQAAEAEARTERQYREQAVQEAREARDRERDIAREALADRLVVKSELEQAQRELKVLRAARYQAAKLEPSLWAKLATGFFAHLYYYDEEQGLAVRKLKTSQIRKLDRWFREANLSLDRLLLTIASFGVDRQQEQLLAALRTWIKPLEEGEAALVAADILELCRGWDFIAQTGQPLDLSRITPEIVDNCINQVPVEYLATTPH